MTKTPPASSSKRIELLAPAGGRQSVVAAVNGGCDSIYIGGESFNARIAAENFSADDMNEIIDYCHLRGVKVYITLNTLYKNSELRDVLNFAEKMYSFGADAFIVQDIGFYSIIRKALPDIKLHASTQMTVHNLEGVKFLQRAGFDRVVLSRELALSEIAHITDNSDIEIETFIHGALCVCFSGSCLFSSMIGDRSGNRGRCAQPCRLKYSLCAEKELHKGYLLNPKDLMGLNLLPKLKGVSALKIEGRMKSPEYVAAVTSVYRKYIDLLYNGGFETIDENDVSEITSVFSRGGSFTEGYYTSYSKKEMISAFPGSSGMRIGVVKKYDAGKCDIRLDKELVPGDGIEIWTKKEPHVGTGISKHLIAGSTVTLNVSGEIDEGDLVYKSYDKRLTDKLKAFCRSDKRKQNITGEFAARLNEPLYLKLNVHNISVEVFGGIPAPALKQPVTADEIKSRFSKMGNTPFDVAFDKYTVDDNIYLPVNSINNLRREAVSLLCEKLTKSRKRKDIRIGLPKTAVNINITGNAAALGKQLTVFASNAEQTEQALKFPSVHRIYIELNKQNYKDIVSYTESAHKNNTEIFAAFPRILRLHDEPFYNEAFDFLQRSGIDGYLIRNCGELKTTKKIAIDYTLNVLNNSSADFFGGFAHSIMLSPELTAAELETFTLKNAEVLAYGKIPLMTTVQCPVGLYAADKNEKMYCKLKGTSKRFYLTDRKNETLPIDMKCDFCYAQILNGKPVFMLNKLDKLNARYLRLAFTDEPEDLVYDIIYSFDKILLDCDNTDGRVLHVNEYMNTNGFTYGHFFRGVL